MTVPGRTHRPGGDTWDRSAAATGPAPTVVPRPTILATAESATPGAAPARTAVSRTTVGHAPRAAPARLPELPTAVAVAAAGVAVVLYTVAAVRFSGQWVEEGDLAIYLRAGRVLRAGHSLYFTSLHHNSWTYPPFAALVFVPLTRLPATAARVLFLLGNASLLLVTAGLALRGLGHPLDGLGRRWTLLLAAAGLSLEPVLQSVRLGQVNLALMALVLVDVVVLRRSRAAGVLIGVATAVKIVPGLFVVYLLLTRRLRAAAVAGATVALSIAVGFVLVPAASRDYWLRGLVFDTARVGSLTSPDAQSLRSTLARLLGQSATTTAAWWVLAALTAAGGLLAAAAAARRGAELVGLTVTGLVACTVSPFSWDHHWVWFLPLLVLAVDRAARRGNRSGWLLPLAVWAATAAWVVRAPVAPAVQPLFGLIRIPGPGWAATIGGALYPALAYLVLAVLAGRLVGRRQR